MQFIVNSWYWMLSWMMTLYCLLILIGFTAQALYPSAGLVLIAMLLYVPSVRKRMVRLCNSRWLSQSRLNISGFTVALVATILFVTATALAMP
ncbi:Uncharacterised protein [Moraxella caviae]|uniref:Uncharacterized protein n=1 Tax=Moraxella caviae TaxID=34060 RepID=A0A378R6J0_9GAMM|nr:hypothetical protein [Moraxella caviae]STZ13605.1 Uncharacterised protein [Moraxella caviae]VEW13305.1 Uncharacterised protein [Moraxella caviae]